MMYKKFIDDAQKWYGPVKNTTGKLVFKHAIEVAEAMEQAEEACGEDRPEVKKLLFLGSLGHDLLEDSKVSTKTIEKEWGTEALSLIKSLTNDEGDKSFDKYIEKLSKSSEEVLLVKYADILANIDNSIEHIGIIDPDWVKTFWLPLLHRYDEKLLNIKFKDHDGMQEYFAGRIREKIAELEKVASG